MKTRNRLKALEARLGEPPRPPCFFIRIAGDTDPTKTAEAIAGYSCSSSAYGPARTLWREHGEPLEALEARCAALNGIVWRAEYAT